jgi:pimeloyl-ACP methyl ester carboxylesterase
VRGLTEGEVVPQEFVPTLLDHWRSGRFPVDRLDFFNAKNISIPFAISVFPDELYEAPRSWAQRAYPNNLIHYNKLDRGGHFAAWEQPQLFSEEMRVGFRSLRA